MLKEIEGNLFDSKAKYIVHQANCVTKRAAHLAYDIFKKYPYADIYSCRNNSLHSDAILDKDEHCDKPGDIIIRGNGKDQRYVIAILGQFFPGAPRYPDSPKDGSLARQKYFHQGLLKIAQIDSLDSVAFPWSISCGAAGGDWNIYHKIIKKFAEHLNNKAEVFIYKLL